MMKIFGGGQGQEYKKRDQKNLSQPRGDSQAYNQQMKI